MDTKGMIIWAVFIAVCAAIIIVSRRTKKQIDENGIEVDAVVSRISESSGIMDGEGVSYDYYVRYRTLEGEEIEGLLLDADPGVVEGQHVRIKYHPKHKLNAKLA